MSYVALDWHPKAKELFYNEKAAEEFAQNESYHMVNTIQFSVKYILRFNFIFIGEKVSEVQILGPQKVWLCKA